MTFNSEMMTMARERRGMSQRALADAIGLTQATVSRYESGLVAPPAEHIKLLAKVFDRPEGFFHLQERLYGATSFFHRRRKSLSLTEDRKIRAQVNELRIRSTILLREAEIRSKFEFHRLVIDKGPEHAARVLRQLWQLPAGPVRSVVGSIERAGGIVFRCAFGTKKVDGISQWPIGEDVPPVFFVNEDVPGDRQRWTLAHEIAHLVLHHLPTDAPEPEADTFAGEFLMPAKEIGPDLDRLTLPTAAALKGYWRVSMASIVRRALQLEKITERQYRYLHVQLAERGYKTCEPVPIPCEEPSLFTAIIDVHRRAHGRHVRELSGMLEMHEKQFREEIWNNASGLRIA